MTRQASYMEMYGKLSFSNLPIEWACWVSALALLYLSNPHSHHFTLCPLENMGGDWCPGCGLGRSIALLMHGEIRASFGMHWLGIPALLIIVHRIYRLSQISYISWKKNNHHEQP